MGGRNLREQCQEWGSEKPDPRCKVVWKNNANIPPKSLFSTDMRAVEKTFSLCSISLSCTLVWGWFSHYNKFKKKRFWECPEQAELRKKEDKKNLEKQKEESFFLCFCPCIKAHRWGWNLDFRCWPFTSLAQVCTSSPGHWTEEIIHIFASLWLH